MKTVKIQTETMEKEAGVQAQFANLVNALMQKRDMLSADPNAAGQVQQLGQIIDYLTQVAPAVGE